MPTAFDHPFLNLARERVVILDGGMGTSLHKYHPTDKDWGYAPNGKSLMNLSDALVYTHPETGRRALYLGRRRNAYLDGLPLDESEALLDEIWAEATREPLTWRHQWRVGDLVLWDNRCTMHRRDSFDPACRRVMHRTQIRSN